jgi:hypothetical protein
MWWIIIIVAILIFLFAKQAKHINSKTEAANKSLLNRGIDVKKQISVGNYIGGHPDLDDVVPQCGLIKRESELVIIAQKKYLDIHAIPEKIASIPIESIDNIEVLDKTEVENKVTLGRILLVGIFALAWKKKQVLEAAYITIEWRSGRFTHTTIFEIEGKESLIAAKKARNELIKAVGA